MEVIPSMTNSASYFRASFPTSGAGFLIPALVSLWTIVTISAPASSSCSRAARSSGVPHSDSRAVTVP